MDTDRWNAVENYFEDVLCLRDAQSDVALDRARTAGLPMHGIAPNQGKLLQIFAQMSRVRRILEIGTPGGYSAICMARALPEGGRLVSLESDAGHARLARENVRLAGLAAYVQVVSGDAGASLQRLIADQEAPFDMIFIDAGKGQDALHLAAALKLSRDGTVIVAGNLIRDGRLVEGAWQDEPDVRSVRTFLGQMAHDLRLNSTAIQTVGSTGWDGFSVAVVSK